MAVKKASKSVDSRVFQSADSRAIGLVEQTVVCSAEQKEFEWVA